jgi:hypothetical protein
MQHISRAESIKHPATMAERFDTDEGSAVDRLPIEMWSMIMERVRPS